MAVFRRPSAASRLCALLLLALLGAGCSAALSGPAAAPSPTVEPITPPNAPGITLEARAAVASYRIGSWLPVRVTVQNESADIVGEVRVSGGRTATAYAAPLDLPRGARKSATVYAYIPSVTRRLSVRLMTGDQQLAQQTLTLNAFPGNTRLVGVVAGEGGSLQLPEMLVNGSRVVVESLAAADLPDHALGLSTFDLLVLSDVPSITFSEAQRAALLEWVARGGRLVLGGGAGAQRTLEGLPAELRPAVVRDVRRISAAELLSRPGDGESISVAEVKVAENARVDRRPSSALRAEYAPPALLERPVGRGSVIFFAASLGELKGWPDAARFWTELLPVQTTLPPGFAPGNMNTDMFTESNIASALTSLPALEFPSLLTLGSLLLAYILLVGPITYFVLRRLDRQAWGWVVVPAITVIFAAMAYGLGYAQRGGDVVFNQITLVEPLHHGDGAPALARVRSFVGVFSPAQRGYLLDAGGGEGGAALLMRPISVQGPWETGAAQRGVFTQQPAGAQVKNLEVAQWSMRAIIADEVRPYQGLRARVVLEGDTLTGEAVNEGGEMLSDVTLVQGNRVARLGNLGPGERRSGELHRDAGIVGKFGQSPPLSYLVYGEQLERAGQPGGQPLPPELQLRVRMLDALFSYGTLPRGPEPLLFGWSQQALLEVQVPDQRVARQQLTMLVATLQLDVAGKAVTLDQGWMERRFDEAPGGLCMGSRGLGVTLTETPTIGTLHLPASLSGLRPAELTIWTAADGMWPAEATLALFDWERGDWESQDSSQRALRVERPERFLSPEGTLRVRLEGPPPQQNTAGCVYVDVSAKGVLP